MAKTLINKRQLRDPIRVGAVSGTSAYVGTFSPAPTGAYIHGQKYQLKPNATSTGNITLDAGLGPINVYKNPTNQATAGDWVANQWYIVVFDQTYNSGLGGFSMTGSGGGGGADLTSKSDKLFTYSEHAGNYTIGAPELTLINAGASAVIIGDDTGDLELPDHATLALPIKCSFGIRGYGTLIAPGLDVTGTNGTLSLPDLDSGNMAILEQVEEDVWVLHNGSPSGSVPPWDDTDAGVVERSIQSEMEAVASGAQANDTTGLSDSRTGSEIGLFYMIRKIMTLAWSWSAQQTFAIGSIVTDATANTPAWFNGSKKIVAAVVTDFLDWLGINPISAAVSLSSTTITLNCNSKYSRKWYTSTAHSANFTLTKTNKTNLEYGNYVFLVTGTIVIQLDSDDRMTDDSPGWNYASKQVTIVSGGTGVAYDISYNKVGSIYKVTLSSKTTV